MSNAREKLIELLEKTPGIGWSPSARQMVADHLIAKDVVPVVRCKDCKHCIYLSYIAGDVRCGNLHTGYITENSFCSYGERREGE